MSEINTLQINLQKEPYFNLFTKLLKRKIQGGMLSGEYLDEKERLAIDEVGFVECKVIFDCPYCHETCHIDSKTQEFECDCGNLVNIRNIKTEIRCVLSKKVHNSLQTIFSQKWDYDTKTIRCIFCEKEPITSQHDSTIYLHVSPFLNNQNNKFRCIDNAYVDHFRINWKIFPDILDDLKRDALLKDILQWRKETILKQIDWTKINEWDFQNLTIELLESEHKFSKIIPGGKGQDQGKDAIGYSTIDLPTGKPMEVTTLIQCKYTEKEQTFSTDDIQKYVTKSKRHGCNTLLFVTNGSLSGDAVTEINSGAYNDKDFFDVDFWAKQKLFNLLEKYPIIRIKYFYMNT